MARNPELDGSDDSFNFGKRREWREMPDDEILPEDGFGSLLTPFQLQLIKQREAIASSLGNIEFLRMKFVDRAAYILQVLLVEQRIQFRVGPSEEFNKLTGRQVENIYQNGITHLVVIDHKKELLYLYEVLDPHNPDKRILAKEILVDLLFKSQIKRLHLSTRNDQLKLTEYIRTKLLVSLADKEAELHANYGSRLLQQRGDKRPGATFEELWGETLQSALADFK